MRPYIAISTLLSRIHEPNWFLLYYLFAITSLVAAASCLLFPIANKVTLYQKAMDKHRKGQNVLSGHTEVQKEKYAV